MREQFFGRVFCVSIAVMIAALALALFSYRFDIGLPILALVAVAVAFVTNKDPALGLSVIFLELFSNPHGHLIFYDGFSIPLSLRMAVFVGFFIGWAVYLFRSKAIQRLESGRVLFVLPIVFAVAIGFATGFFSNPADEVFKDGNGYFYLLYTLPVFSVQWTTLQKNRLLQIFAAGAFWNVLLTLGVLYLFSHFDETILRSSYVFLRDVRLAEITNLGNGIYRVFIQSQFFTIAFCALAIAFVASTIETTVVTTLSIGFLFTVILLSMSRSFWIGIIPSTLLLLILLFRLRLHRRTWLRLGGISALGIVLAIVIISVTVLFPFPTQRLAGGDLADAFLRRSETNAAISSRWALLTPMQAKIAERPALGNGFGARVSFVSEDPRVLELQADGVWSTYAMEWGWFELWLKMGILGPVGFLILFAFFFKRFLKNQNTDQYWIGIGLLSGLVFLFATHFFSPYLNHPIGLGFILYAFIFLPEPAGRILPVLASEFVGSRKEMPAQAGAFSLRAERK